MSQTGVLDVKKKIKKAKKSNSAKLDSICNGLTHDDEFQLVRSKKMKKSKLADTPGELPIELSTEIVPSAQPTNSPVLSSGTHAGKKQKKKRKNRLIDQQDEVLYTDVQESTQQMADACKIQKNDDTTDFDPHQGKKQKFENGISKKEKRKKRSASQTTLKQKKEMAEPKHEKQIINEGSCSEATNGTNNHKKHKKKMKKKQLARENGENTVVQSTIRHEMEVSIAGPVFANTIADAGEKKGASSGVVDVAKSDDSLKRKVDEIDPANGPVIKKKKKAKSKIASKSGFDESCKVFEKEKPNSKGAAKLRKKSKLKRKKKGTNELNVEEMPVVSAGMSDCISMNQSSLESQIERKITSSSLEKSKLSGKKKKKSKRQHDEENCYPETQNIADHTESREPKKKKLKSRCSDDGCQISSIGTETNVTPCEMAAKRKSKKKRKDVCHQDDERIHAASSQKPKKIDARKKRKRQMPGYQRGGKMDGVETKIDESNLEENINISAVEPAPGMQDLASQQSTNSKLGQWQTVKLSNSSQQNKFVRLLGGAKNNPATNFCGKSAEGESVLSRLSGVWKPPPGRKLFGSLQNREKKTFSTMALSAEDSEKLAADLEGQYKQTLEFNLQKRKEGNVAKGLGFQEDPAKGKKHYIDVHKVNSMALD